MLDVGDDGVYREPSAREREGVTTTLTDSTEITYCVACNIVGEPLIAQNVDGVDITVCEDNASCISRFKPRDNNAQIFYAR